MEQESELELSQIHSGMKLIHEPSGKVVEVVSVLAGNGMGKALAVPVRFPLGTVVAVLLSNLRLSSDA